MRRSDPVTLAAGVVAADQVTKLAAGASDPGGAIEPVTNPDYALGLLSAHPALLSLGTAMVVVALVSWRPGTRQLPWWIAPLLVGGALSNLADRIALGSVRDFVATPWFVFNLADVAIAAAIVGFYRHLVVHRNREEVNP